MNNTSKLASLCGFHGPQSVPLDKLHEVAADRLEGAREMVEALDYMLDELDSTPEINLSSWGIGTSSVRSALAKYRGEV